MTKVVYGCCKPADFSSMPERRRVKGVIFRSVFAVRRLSIVFLNLIFSLSATAFGEQLDPVCSRPASVTNLSLGNGKQSVCWRGKGIRLVGYSAYDTLTTVMLHDEGDTPDVGPTSAVPNAAYFDTLKYTDDRQPKKAAHGINYTRIGIFGHSCSNGATPCKNFSGPELMPFRNLGKPAAPNYDVRPCPFGQQCTCPGGPGCLDEDYKQRLINTLVEADKNGVVVQLSLFDGLFMRRSYSTNPWNPIFNNLDKSDVCGSSALPKVNNPFPEFYSICKSGENPCPSSEVDEAKNKLTCLGLVQKRYVDQIIDIVQNENPDPASRGHFKNVFFEIMQEAPSQTTGKPKADLAVFAQWHNTVGAWIRARGRYLVAASVYPDSRAFWNECKPASCTNLFRAYKQRNVNIVTLHGSTWYNDPCNAVKESISKFRKPVVISDDGTITTRDRNDAAKVLEWAQSATLESCRKTKGDVLFEHLDGDRMKTKKQNTCTREDACLDCSALDRLGEVPPSPCLLGETRCAPDTYSSRYCGNPFPGTN